jgi:hypothetical protein
MIENAPWTCTTNHFSLVGVRPQVRGWIPENFVQGNNYEGFWLSG